MTGERCYPPTWMCGRFREPMPPTSNGTCTRLWKTICNPATPSVVELVISGLTGPHDIALREGVVMPRHYILVARVHSPATEFGQDVIGDKSNSGILEPLAGG